MNAADLEDIAKILKEIKNRSVFVGGGSGIAERASMRDVRIIWDLGTRIDQALNNSKVPNERRKGEVRKIARKMDNQILGKNNDWSNYAYEWFNHFKDLDYYLFVTKLAGYREDNDENRFTKRRVRYLLPIYTKLEESTLTKSKRDKLTKLLTDDSTLSLNDADYYTIIKNVRGRDRVHWSEIRSSLDDLSIKVESAMAMASDELERKELREILGPVLIKQIRYALQLCVMDKKNDFDYAHGIANSKFKEKSKTNNANFKQLFENLKVLIKDFDEKNKHVKKTDYYELEKLNSSLDAISSEEIYREYMKRKNALGEVFD